MGKKMNELERASKLIGDIYDAALDPKSQEATSAQAG